MRIRIVVGLLALVVGGLLGWVAPTWERDPPIDVGWHERDDEPSAGSPAVDLASDTDVGIFSDTAEADSASPSILPQRVEPPKPGGVAQNDPALGPDGKTLTLNAPSGDFVLESLTGGRQVTLNGRIHTLRIKSIDAASTLDASGLVAQHIVVAGKIDGGSTVNLTAPGGLVEFLDKIDGRSTLEVNAPGGTVVFVTAANGERPGSKIDGESRVTITARDVNFRAPVNGTQTHVIVTQTAGGLLRFVRVEGQVRLDYRREKPADPPPKIDPGAILAAAKVQLVD